MVNDMHLFINLWESTDLLYYVKVKGGGRVLSFRGRKKGGRQWTKKKQKKEN